MDTMQRARLNAAAAVNAEDASVWRWFSALLEERRIRWRYAFDRWVITVDRARVAVEPTFYDAIRAAKGEAEQRGIGGLANGHADKRAVFLGWRDSRQEGQQGDASCSHKNQQREPEAMVAVSRQ